VYRSACSTARSDAVLGDQAVHLSAAFRRAGYQHVVGTLMRVGDVASRVIADDFYTYLTSGWTVAPRMALSADALHHAIRRLREKYAASASMWASHVHTGI
jgi:CHAT domain-containing protein